MLTSPGARGAPGHSTPGPAPCRPFRPGAAHDALARARLLYVEADEVPADIERMVELLEIGQALGRAVRAQHQLWAEEAVNRLDAMA